MLTFTSSFLPSRKADVDACPLPLGFLFTAHSASVAQLPHAGADVDDARCSRCRGVCNPYCDAGTRGGHWRCCFCGSDNAYNTVTAPAYGSGSGTGSVGGGGGGEAAVVAAHAAVRFCRSVDGGVACDTAPRCLTFVVDANCSSVHMQQLTATVKAVLAQCEPVSGASGVGAQTWCAGNHDPNCHCLPVALLTSVPAAVTTPTVP